MTEPVLKLTAIIFRGDSPNMLIGCIKEMRGIAVQGESEDAVYRDLVDGVRYMLDFKRDEALALLRTQIHEEYTTDGEIDFSLKRERNDALAVK